MARRKKDYASDYSSDSEGQDSDINDDHHGLTQDERAERELFEQNSGRKKRRLNKGGGKASAWEGIFGEDDEDVGQHDRKGKRNAAFKAPTFVQKSAAGVSSAEPIPQAASEQDESDNSNSSSEANDDASVGTPQEKGPSRTRENSYSDDEEQPGGAGLGSKTPGQGGLASSRGGFGGIGSTRGRGGGGIGSSRLGSGESSKTGASAAGFTMSSFAKSSGTEDAQVKASKISEAGPGLPERPELNSRASNDNLGGIGTTKRHAIEIAEEEALYPSDPAHAMPQSFGQARTPVTQRQRPPRQQQAFRAEAEPEASTSKTKASVTTKDLNHLRSIAGSFGARLLAKQGWAPGKGLGREEDGKAVPIEANVGLARGQGIGKGVRTEQSKREAKERGDYKGASSEEERENRKKRKEKKKEAAPGRGPKAEWKRDRKVKVKVEHKTYDELVAEAAAGGNSTAAGVGLVLDARSGELKEVSSLAELSLAARAATEWTPTGDKMQLPELRHNLRLILESTKGDVQALVKEGQAVRMRREWARRETQRLKQEQQAESLRIERLEEIRDLVASVGEKLQLVDTRSRDPLATLDQDLKSLYQQYSNEYEEYDLDEVVIGAMAHALNLIFRQWEPLANEDVLLQLLLPWKAAFRFSDPEDADDDPSMMPIYGRGDDQNGGKMRSSNMTPYEAMLEKLWLPRVRSALNNDWSVLDPQPAVRFLEAWTPILPRFMRDNVLNQLILPKISSQVGDWNPRRQKVGSQYSLASVVFPWLSVLHDRFDGVLDEAKIRISETMKRWSIKETIPEEWKLWKDIFSKGKWDTLMLLNIVPKLAAHIDNDFEVNPLDQKMEPLDRVLNWSSLLRESTFAQIIEEKFFPSWLDTLHFWLVQPNYSAGEVASWYHFWKDHFSRFTTAKGDKLTDNRGIDHGFRAGLSLMNDAMTLGTDAPTLLQKPKFIPLLDRKIPEKKSKTASRQRNSAFAQPSDGEVTFKSIAEQYAADRNLLFIPTGRSHATTGKQLFKVAKGLDARGVTVYVGEDAVYAQSQDGTFRAVLLDDMVKMATS